MAKTLSPKNISRIVPALTARTQFGQILRRVRENRERFVVEKRGDPQAVIMSIEEYLKHFARPIPGIEELRKEAKAKGMDRLTMREINQEIRRYRREQRRKR
jgi:prevent-host-death family protein